MFRCYFTLDFDDLESLFREQLILYYLRQLFLFSYLLRFLLSLLVGNYCHLFLFLFILSWSACILSTILVRSRRKIRRWGNKKYWSCNARLVRVSLHSRGLSTFRPKSTEADALPFGAVLTPSFCPRLLHVYEASRQCTPTPSNNLCRWSELPVAKNRLRAAEMHRWNVERWPEFLKKLIFPSKCFSTRHDSWQMFASSLRARYPDSKKASICIIASVPISEFSNLRKRLCPAFFKSIAFVRFLYHGKSYLFHFWRYSYTTRILSYILCGYLWISK